MVSCRLASTHTHKYFAVPIYLHVVQTTIAFSGKIEHYSSSLDVIRLRRGLVHKNMSRACFCTACLTKFHSGAGHGLLPCPLLCHHVPSEVEGLCLEEASPVGQVAAGMGPKEEGRQPGPRCLSASYSSKSRIVESYLRCIQYMRMSCLFSPLIFVPLKKNLSSVSIPTPTIPKHELLYHSNNT